MKKGKQGKTKLSDLTKIEGWTDLKPNDKEMLELKIAEEASLSSAMEQEVGIHLRSTEGGNNKYWEIAMLLTGDKHATKTR